MKKVIIAIIALFGIAQTGTAQVSLGTISGKTLNDDSTEVVPLARVWVDVGGSLRGTQSDMNGNYKIDALEPGLYILHAKTLIEGEITVSNVKVNPDGITTVDIIMNNDNVLRVVDVPYNAVKIEKDVPKIKLLIEDIEHSPYIRDPKRMLAESTTDIQIMEGSDQIIIRGSRPGDVIYYIDGVKVGDLTGVPGAALGGVEAFTGGIPAKYGDTMGGVISLETKGYFDLYYAWKATQNNK